MKSQLLTDLLLIKIKSKLFKFSFMETLPVPSMIVFLFWQFVPLAFVQALYFCSLPGINMYVPGDCKILLKSVRDL